MKLIFKEECVKIIDSQNFKRFVESIYGGSYDFESCEESLTLKLFLKQKQNVINILI